MFGELTFDWFFDTLGELDWLAAVVGAVAMMVLGYIWYGVVFKAAWGRATGTDMNARLDPMVYVQYLVSLILFNAGLAYFQAEGVEHALVLAVLFGVLFLLPVLYGRVLWLKYSATAFWIDWFYWLVGIAVAGFVQGLFV